MEALDRGEEARRLIAEEGVVFESKSTGAKHLHAALKLERESRQPFVRWWSELGLGWEMELDGKDAWFELIGKEETEG